MRDPLPDLAETLLRAGIAPIQVHRYLRELTEHRDDLYDHLRQQGLPAETARSKAERLLGSTDALLLPMLAERRFRSRAARWPAFFYLVLPLMLQAALAVSGIVGLAWLSSTALRPALPDLGNGVALLWLAAPVLIAWLALLAARRRRAALHWPIAGAVAGAALASALQLGVALPLPGSHGEISLALGLPALLPLVTLALLSLLPLSLPAIRT